MFGRTFEGERVKGETMKCPHCGREIQSWHLRCIYCGKLSPKGQRETKKLGKSLFDYNEEANK